MNPNQAVPRLSTAHAARWKKVACFVLWSSLAPCLTRGEETFSQKYEAQKKAAEQKVVQLKEKIRANPQDVDAQVELGWAYFDSANVSQADNQFEQVVRDHPEHAGGRLARGTM